MPTRQRRLDYDEGGGVGEVLLRVRRGGARQRRVGVWIEDLQALAKTEEASTPNLSTIISVTFAAISAMSVSN